MRSFMADRRGSAARWFALAAVMIAVVSTAGAHGLAWLTEPGRVSIVAYRTPAAAPLRSTADSGIDATPTGSVPSNAVMIRIR